MNHRHRIGRVVIAAASLGMLSVAVTGCDYPGVVPVSDSSALTTTATAGTTPAATTTPDTTTAPPGSSTDEVDPTTQPSTALPTTTDAPTVSTTAATTTTSAATTTTKPPTTTSAPTTTKAPTTTSAPTTTKPPTTTTAPATTTRPTAGSGSQAAQVLDLVNKERRSAGCDPVADDTRLRKAAQAHAEDMAENDYFSHTSQDGRSFVDRIKAAGYPSPGGENIAKGQRDAEAVMRAWMNSEGHRRNILNCSFRSLGVGVDSDGPVWVQDFGR